LPNSPRLTHANRAPSPSLYLKYINTTALTESNRAVKTKEEYDRRKLRTSTLSKQLKDAVSRFQNVQFQNGQKSKDTVARQYRIANPAATEEDVRRLVDSDQGGVFSQQVIVFLLLSPFSYIAGTRATCLFSKKSALKPATYSRSMLHPVIRK